MFQTETDAANVIYWAIAGPVGLVGIWLIMRGLFRDRAKGRPRCPRCLYDLTAKAMDQPDALPMDCPECGRSIRYGWQLFMTRPHKRVTALGLALLIGCLYGTQVRHRVQEGSESIVTAIVPTTYWIVVSPSSSQAVFERVVDRAWPYRWNSERDALWFWQRALLVKASGRILQQETGSFAEMALEVQIKLARTSDAALGSVIEALGSRDRNISRRALSSLPSFMERAWPAWRQATAMLVSVPSINYYDEVQLYRLLGGLGNRPFEEMSDETLCAVVAKVYSNSSSLEHAQVINLYLSEMARRKTPACQEWLQNLVLDRSNKALASWHHQPFNLELLTAYCRSIGESDPVVLRVVSPLSELRATAKVLPKVEVELLYARPPQRLITMQVWNGQREQRNMLFRFEVRDEAGRQMPIKQHMFHDSVPGLKPFPLGRAGGYRTTLDMNHHLQPLKVGRYSVTIQYCSSWYISGKDDISQAITIAAAPFELVVE